MWRLPSAGLAHGSHGVLCPQGELDYDLISRHPPGHVFIELSDSCFTVRLCSQPPRNHLFMVYLHGFYVCLVTLQKSLSLHSALSGHLPRAQGALLYLVFSSSPFPFSLATYLESILQHLSSIGLSYLEKYFLKLSRKKNYRVCQQHLFPVQGWQHTMQGTHEHPTHQSRCYLGCESPTLLPFQGRYFSFFLLSLPVRLWWEMSTMQGDSRSRLQVNGTRLKVTHCATRMRTKGT